MPHHLVPEVSWLWALETSCFDRKWVANGGREKWYTGLYRPNQI